MKNRLLIILISGFVLVSACSFIPKPYLGKPYKTAGIVSEAEQKTIKIGLRLHNGGEYNNAVQKFKKVLSINPKNVEALYRTADSYAEMEKYDSAFAYLQKSMKYKSNFLGHSYDLLGVLYYELDYPVLAESVFERGIELQPFYLLYYNLGFVHSDWERYDKAEQCFFSALNDKPDHASSNFELANLYSLTNQRFPSLFTSFKFLTQEPNSERSLSAVNNIFDCLFSGVQKRSGVSYSYASTNKDNRFLMMSMNLNAAVVLGEFEDDLKSINHVSVLSKLPEIFLPFMKDKSLDFFDYYYLKFFKELNAAGFYEVFTHYILQSIDKSYINKWLLDHKDQVVRFEKWIKEYEYKTSK